MNAETERARWKRYYDANRDKVKDRNRERYYAKKGIPVPERKGERKSPAKKPVATDDNVKRLEALVEELRALVPHAMRPKRVKKGEAEPKIDAEPKD